MNSLYGRYKKAIRGAAAVVLPWAGLVVASAQPGITASEWLALAVAVFGVGGVVAGTTNQETAP